ncbi:MAG: CRTAC1 family protein [Acidobacteria bacterium]|nr:CRTAC1 family protein [Acidobacteriota bacterium]
MKTSSQSNRSRKETAISKRRKTGFRIASSLSILAVGLLAFSMALSAVNESESAIRFEEVSQKAGVQHLHHTRKFQGKSADVLGMFTSGGSSVAVGDFDNDGWDDLFVTDSDTNRPNRLFRSNGDGTFTDLTVSAEVGSGNDSRSIVSDALWFDYDNDGWRDLLVARFGTPILYHNEGNHKFRDVTIRSGLNEFANTIAVIAFDYDNDGYLDLLFGNYFQPENLISLKNPKVLPNDLDNAVNGGGVGLWRNNGNGTFANVTAKAGLDNQKGWILDVGHGDLNNNGFQDIYLAGDYGTDRMYLNNGDGTFTDVTEKALGGFDTKKGMNAEFGDYDNDGLLDIYVTNITDEYMKECNMLWHNDGGTFTDLSKETGTCDTLWGWAAKFGDFDNDGWVDLIAVNGLRSAGKENYIPVLFQMMVTPGIDFSDVNNWPNIGNMSWSGYQKKKLFHNLRGQVFKEISAEAGVDNDSDGRGIGITDFDNDGRLDFYQTNADQPSQLYWNRSAGAGNWVELKLEGTKSNRDAIGARIALQTDELTLLRMVDGGNGYAGQGSTRVHFGLGRATKVNSVEIRWPSGHVDKLAIPINKISYIREGGTIRK